MIDKLTIILFFFFLTKGLGQNSINGFVIDSQDKQPLVGATVIIKNPESKAILKYDITDSKGRFEITFKQSDTIFLMEISYLGYKKWNQIFNKPITDIIIKLEQSTEALDEIVVESYAIEQQKDTISYNINQLKKSSDAVISDVIKRLPGIDVKPTGEIFYQGKPINKYYIEGLDLLEGRYNLANENLSVNSVSKVEVLENHQPIRILDSLEVSDRAALNIKLKNNVTASGSATGSLGWDTSPLWESNVTPLLFAKNKQFLGSYQSNNIGKDILSQTKDFFRKQNTRSPINLASPNTPPLNKQFWLDNISHLGSVNFLTRNKKGVDNKFAISYSNENQLLKGTTITNYFLVEDSVEVRERISSKYKNVKLQGSHIIEKNTEKTYFKNEIAASFFSKDNRSDILRELEIREFLDDTSFSINQSLTKIIPIGKYVFDFNTINSLRNQDFIYEINPAQFSEQLQSPNSLITAQNIENNFFKTSNFVRFRRDFGFLKMNSKVGFDFLSEQFNSAINPIENRLDLTNSVNYKNRTYYIEPSLNFKNKYIEGIINLSLKRRLLKFDLNNENELIEETFTNFEPNGWAKLKLSQFLNSRFSFSINNTFGNTNSIYPNFVITNYRNIQRFNSSIPRSLSKDYSLSLNYRNALKGIFGGISYSNKITENNLLYSTSIDNNGFLEIIAIPENNEIDNENISLNLGKRISSIKTIINLGFGYIQNISDRIINESPITVDNTVFNYRFSVDTDLTNKLSLYLKGDFQSIEGNIDNNTISQIQQQEFNSTILYNINENSYFNLSNDFFRTKPIQGADFQNTNFLNFEYLYKLKKKKIDFFFKWQNILNTGEYISSSFNENFSNLSTFEIRPSQFLFGVRISL